MYQILITVFNLALKVLAPLNKKIRKGNIGREKTIEEIQKKNFKSSKIIWLHCASLGEYEQGLPVFKELKKRNK